jgi:hypothetical protein
MSFSSARLFKPLSGCPLCGGAFRVDIALVHNGSFTRRWHFSVKLVCTECLSVSEVTSESSKPPAVAEFLRSIEEDRQRLETIRRLEAQIVELVTAQADDAQVRALGETLRAVKAKA